SNGVHPRSQYARVKASRNPPTLFDFVPTNPAADELPAPEEIPAPAVASTLTATEAVNPSAEPASRPEHLSPATPFTIASGEKAKARDILAAIRVVKEIDHELRPVTDEERQTLTRFAGFGPVALSIFPDPVNGRYKDHLAGPGREAGGPALSRGIRQRKAH